MLLPTAETTARQRPVRILIVEDSEDDVLLLVWELKRGGYDLYYEAVDTRIGMEAALRSGPWDIVISDYSMPDFSGLEALATLRAHALDIPFVIVSGNIGEDVAVETMKAGAHDYVMKRNLSRLIPALDRELREADVRRARVRAERELRENEARFRAIASNIPGTVYQFMLRRDGNRSFPYVSGDCSRLLGVSPEVLQASPGVFRELICPLDRDGYDQALGRSAEHLTDLNWEGRIQLPGSDEIKWINLRSSPRVLEDEALLWEGVIWNITQSKLAQIEIRRSRQQLQELSDHVQKVKEDERARIAREIHDDIGGNLTAIKIDLLWLANRLPTEQKSLHEKAVAIERLVDRTMETTQRISRDLRPGILDLGLIAAIEWQAEEFQRRMAIPCEVTTSDDDVYLDQDLCVAIFRIFQETLTNISKYAEATRVDVSLVVGEDVVVLEVFDNGRGIARDQLSKPGSFGIRGMQERARSLGGDVEIEGLSGAGTRIKVEIPLPTAPDTASTLTQKALF
ncbi:MAG: response regulator [Burkholderiales bacterium]|nr:response regulator [Burkholderiales bacterium]